MATRRLIVGGYVEGLFTKMEVTTTGGLTSAPAYRCRNCDTLIVAQSPDKVPPHDCDPAAVH
ncbi:conserved hypothetical protein [Anaeromyxobacter dehalogenans 2CP-1]|uniref:Uncharacterized protein n=1 Tax=Anaeromyxobacter dehalogenans (strain ATCC BAA-258 / DSM 21875 / 2CP-1) TaxID=455488 RepID=B8JHN8_ANAD2|nr:hypothetical protein [Anaeromyxobacter dehalogenans]ACL66750.1 conserved hypothetical protein [Anaeromyxobacter dehalogenans 2CP-1]